MTKLYTRANLYAEIAKLNRRIRALERDNRLLREAASRLLAQYASLDEWFESCATQIRTDPSSALALVRACAPLAAKRKERK